MKYPNITALTKWLSCGTAAIALLAVGSLSAATQGYWRFEEGAFRDNTAGKDGDLTGVGASATGYVAGGAGSDFPDPVPRNGQPNKRGARFDGSGFVASKDVDGGDFTSAAGLTFEVLFNAESFSRGTNAFGGIWGDGRDRSFLFGVRGSANKLRVAIHPRDGSKASANSSLEVEPGKDYYAAARIDGDNDEVVFLLRNLTDGGPLRRDRRTLDFQSAEGFEDDGSPMLLGGLAGTDAPFFGLIDEVRVSDTVLPESRMLIVPEKPDDWDRPVVHIAAVDAPADVRDEADWVAKGADDHAVIQSVIDTFSYWGGDVRLSEGAYEIAAPIEVPSRVKLIGVGREKTLLRLDPDHVSLGLNTGVIRVYGADTEIRDLAVDGSNPDNREVEYRNNRSSGVYLDADSANALLENIAVRNTTRHGVCVLGRGHVLRNIRAEKAGWGYCMSIGDGSRVRPGARNIRVEDLFVRDSGGRGGIEINDGVDGVVIDGFYSGGHGNHTRGAVHIREHQRSDEFVRNVTLRNGVIDMRDTTVDYERPTCHGVIVRSTRDYNPFRDIALEMIEFRHVHDVGVLLQGNLDGVRLNRLDFANVGGQAIRIESVGGLTPRDITEDGRASHVGN